LHFWKTPTNKQTITFWQFTGFQCSKLKNINPKTRYAYKVLRGVGVDNKRDGILTHNRDSSCISGKPPPINKPSHFGNSLAFNVSKYLILQLAEGMCN
jgi:hypothetical protein